MVRGRQNVKNKLSLLYAIKCELDYVDIYTVYRVIYVVCDTYLMMCRKKCYFFAESCQLALQVCNYICACQKQMTSTKWQTTL